MTLAETIATAVARSKAVAEVTMGARVIPQAGEVFRRNFDGDAACLVADEAAWRAAGPAVEAALAASGLTVRVHRLPADPRPKPSAEQSDAIRAVLAQDDATPVAIGSGVMNDLVKHAAFGLGRPYLCVATAASMDGYTSAGAPLSQDGFKMTIPCRPARVVIADLDVIAAAPPEMSAWGYGDMAGKVPAGADWILADALGIEPIDDVAWPMVQDGLQGWLSDPASIARGDRSGVEGLFTGLCLVGLAMEAHGSSRPASGADHQIAHLWEMEGLRRNGTPVSHGACVAVGCVAVLRLYDWLLGRDLSALDPKRIADDAPSLGNKADAIRAALGPGPVADRALQETSEKHLAPAALSERIERLRAGWPDLSRRLRAQVVPPDRMAAMLRAAGAPAMAAEIGVDADHLRRTILGARFLRSRYTVLDLLDECGLLEEAVTATTAPEIAA